MGGFLALAILFWPDDSEKGQGQRLTGEELARYNRSYLKMVLWVFGPIIAVLIALCIYV